MLYPWPWAWHSHSSLPRACPPRGCLLSQASTLSYLLTWFHRQVTTPSTHSITRPHQQRSHIPQQLFQHRTTCTTVLTTELVFLRAVIQAGFIPPPHLPCPSPLLWPIRCLCSKLDSPAPQAWPRWTVSTVMLFHTRHRFQLTLNPSPKFPVQTLRQIFPHHPQRAQKTLWVISALYLFLYVHTVLKWWSTHPSSGWNTQILIRSRF